MFLLVVMGILLTAAGAVVKGTSIGKKIGSSAVGSSYGKKIFGNTGEILLVVGVVCIAAGVANLYYGFV